jgi:hypothetical protein
MQAHEQQAMELIRPYKDSIHRVLNIGFVSLPDATVRIVESLGITAEVLHLEIWAANLARGQQSRPEHLFLLGDVRQIPSLELGLFDLIVWWHGPEHIYPQELVQAIRGLEQSLTEQGHIILGSPDGWQAQTNDDGNQHNDHVSGPDTEFYQSLGYQVHRVWAPLWSLVAYKGPGA